MKFLTLCALCLLAASFAGALHPVGDSLAVFRPLLAVLCLGSVFFWRKPSSGAMRIAALGGLAGFASVIYGFNLFVTLSGEELTLYQKNMYVGAKGHEGVLSDIKRLDPDVITLQEISARHIPLLNALRADYPTQHFCPHPVDSGVAVLTKFAPSMSDNSEEKGICIRDPGFAAIKVRGPRGDLWLSSIHMRWPWPYRQPAQLDKILPRLTGFDAPVVLAGDFNMVPWGTVLSRFEAAVEGKRAGPARMSFMLKGLYPMPIDHVIGPKGGLLFQRPSYHSDHNGLFARLPL